MTSLGSNEVFIIRPKIGIGRLLFVPLLRQAPWGITAVFCISLSTGLSLPGREWPGIILASLVVMGWVYLLGRDISERASLAVQSSGVVFLGRYRLTKRTPLRIVLKPDGHPAVFHTSYSHYVEYENGRLLIARRIVGKKVNQQKQLARELAAFLGIFAYVDDGSGGLKKLAGQQL
ncbi:hypothetical protein BK653_03630 [Pseudomonas brassicacearum]|uniref:hypothetical protein n=1 Tax=Pseudomonas brassicacearum TaxID=930166 RepID=UPI000F4ACB3D|nr:hypothetical protein [Pseudomonas brassicacearum]ROM70986.1 hypothetical protein BK653_03630 [Pseudomonas brassicacearum]